jgi:regulator of nucleoside diphosphate kinase
LQQLDAELARAEIVAPELLGRDVVRMNSVVQFRDLDSGARRVYQLVYPHDADLERGRVSILAPVGCALLGLSVGQKIAWPLPAGRTRNLEVVSVAQPSGEQGMTPVADPACVAS